MRTLPIRVAAASAAYVAASFALFSVLRWWGGGSVWGESVLHDVRAISPQHHFVPPWTLAFAVIVGCALVATALALGFVGRRAVRSLIVGWAALFTTAGVLMAAIPRLSVLATEPGSMGLGHTAPHAAAGLIFVGFALMLRFAVPDLFGRKG
jgi:hypothetical protein